jgi:hypothetical protein
VIPAEVGFEKGDFAFETLVFGVERGGIVAGILCGRVVVFEEVVVKEDRNGTETRNFDVVFIKHGVNVLWVDVKMGCEGMDGDLFAAADAEDELTNFLFHIFFICGLMKGQRYIINE